MTFRFSPVTFEIETAKRAAAISRINLFVAQFHIEFKHRFVEEQGLLKLQNESANLG